MATFLEELKQHVDESNASYFKRKVEEIKEEIMNIDINTLTPVEALMKLNEIKRMLVKK